MPEFVQKRLLTQLSQNYERLKSREPYRGHRLRQIRGAVVNRVRPLSKRSLGRTGEGALCYSQLAPPSTPAPGADELVKISVADTTSDYLANKITSADATVTFAIVNPGGNEDLDLSVPNPIPSGVIVMWSGLIANVPDGWFLCDGYNSTPDLRDYFIRSVAADGASYPVSGVDTVNDTFNVFGDRTAAFVADVSFEVTGSTGNDGKYTVIGSVYAFPNTTISVVEDVTNAVADGTITVYGEAGVVGGANAHSHANHAVTQPNNHVVTQPTAHSPTPTSQASAGATQRGSTASTLTLLAHTHNTPTLTHIGTAVDAHSGTNVDAHSTENNIPVYYKLAFIMKA